MCQVEFVSDRGNKLGISCKTTVTEGMNVSVSSVAAKKARASVEEMLLLNHPLDCPICDKAGECSLQNYYMEHDLQESRQNFTRFRKEKAKDIGPTHDPGPRALRAVRPLRALFARRRPGSSSSTSRAAATRPTSPPSRGKK